MDRRHGVGSGAACPFDWCRFDGAGCAPLRFVARLGNAACGVGASGGGLVRGTLGAALMMLFLGRPYGAFLNWVRGLFGLPPGGERPMSLDS